MLDADARSSLDRCLICARRPPAGSHLGQSEVKNLGVAALRHKDIGRLDIAMNDALDMRGIKCVGDLNCQTEKNLGIDRAARDLVLQGHAVQIFHDDEGAPLVLAEVIDCADIGMIERRCGARLAAEALHGLGIAGDVVRQELECNRTTKVGILGLENNAHTTAAELLEYAVV